jgi:adenylate cyclase
MSLQSGKLKTNIVLIARITLAWMFIGLTIMLYDWVTTADNFYYLRTENYNFWAHMATMIFGGFVGGVIGGSFLVLVSMSILKKKSFPVFVVVNSIAVLLFIVAIDIIVTDLSWSVMNERWFFDEEAIQFTADTVFNWRVIRSMAIWFVVMLTTSFVLRVDEKYGPGVLMDILKGKYHQPREEERIFMFLDIKSSTAIAEKIGHDDYFRLLSDFFADISDAIRYNKGAIYQYVGDEVVITWKIKQGLQDCNCLNCFFDARAELAKQAEKYMERYAIVPEFKAGIHAGATTIGELGVLKKEIAFSGDVLNTTSRIQNECNKHQAELLISEDLLKALNLNSNFTVEKIGDIALKGKEMKTHLYSVKKIRPAGND